MRILATLYVLVGVVAVPAAAQHPLVLDKLGELNARAPQPALAELERIATAAGRTSAAANKMCVPTAVRLSDVAPITGARGIMQGVLSGALRNAWTGFARHVGCADSDVVQYLFIQKADGTTSAAIVNEGQTLANPTLIRDTSGPAALVALAKAKSIDAKCTGDATRMGRTRVESRSPDLGPEYYGARYTGSWTEVWQYKICGRTFDVPIEFKPDGDGGAFTNINAKAVAVLP